MGIVKFSSGEDKLRLRNLGDAMLVESGLLDSRVNDLAADGRAWLELASGVTVDLGARVAEFVTA